MPKYEDLPQLSPCSHEEAHTRIILHCVHAAIKVRKKIIVRSVDTDVVVLVIANYHKLAVDELWIAFGSGSSFRYLPVHLYASAMGQEKARALPIFHAITGCDTVSSFYGRGKKSAWEAMTSYELATRVFLQLAASPNNISDE